MILYFLVFAALSVFFYLYYLPLVYRYYSNMLFDTENQVVEISKKTNYDWYIKSEHINLPYEIINELKKKFIINKKTYFPIPLSFEFCNLCIAINLKLKN